MLNGKNIVKVALEFLAIQEHQFAPRKLPALSANIATLAVAIDQF